jgi:DNA-binding FadR family transcriptional regulator
VFVAAPSIDAVAEAMAVHLDFQGMDRQQLFEVRCALEVATVNLAATSFDARRIEQLEAMLAAERDAQIDVVGQASHAWHGMIAELTGNRAVLLFLLVLIRLTEERGGVPDQDSAELVWRAHATIMRAIAEHDPERARRRMERHLDAITPTLR